MKRDTSLRVLLSEVRSCEKCEQNLPLGPRPVIQFGSKASVVVVGQAPGTKVHASGVPWQDKSGEHLREWLQVSSSTFYDAEQVALLPMGFCYPGRSGGGDAPPRPECAPQWHERLLGQLTGESLILLVGMYAQKYYLGARRKRTLTETVGAFQTFGPRFFPLPHPSWRSRIWMEKNPWFEAEVLPVLREKVAEKLG